MSTKQKKGLFKIIISALLLAVTFFMPEKSIISLILYIAAYLTVGAEVLFKAARNILNARFFDENFLMALATVGAFAVGEYPEAVAVMLFYQVGELFQALAVGKSRKSIAALMDIRPNTAHLLKNGEEITVSPEELGVGDLLVVRVGEKIPIDGRIISGSTTLDTSSLTGESVPAERAEGDCVVSGSVNIGSVITVEATSVYADSTVAKILELVENTASNKAKAESFITRFAKYYTPAVVVGACVLAIIPSLITGDWVDWIKRALVFLVVSCPCALVISVPLSFFGGIGGCSKRGVLVKGAVKLEDLANARAFVFDKTGTLTEGKFSIEEINPNGISKEELLEITAAAEGFSNHPVAVCIASAVEKSNSAYIVTDVKEIAGRGISAVINGKVYLFGNEAMMRENGIAFEKTTANGTAVYASCEGEYLGSISVADKPKPEAGETIKRLYGLGIKKSIMLTGDNRISAEYVAERVGIDELYAELLPDMKLKHIEEIKRNCGVTVFTGDGINDAPVLAGADIGIAMGALGSDAAIEAADIVITDDSLSKIPEAVGIARKTMKIVRQNIVFALAVKGIILLLGALGAANMWMAVFGDVGVTVIAILNAMRTLRA